MLTIDHKLYITKDVNEIIVSYSKFVVLRKLLTKYSLTIFEHKQYVSELIIAVKFYSDDFLSYLPQLDLLNLIIDFVNACDKKELTALFFWLLNEKYKHYYDDFSHDEKGKDESSKTFNYKFGRELAYKLYNPDAVELRDELHQELKNLLFCFTLEFDFSLIDENSIVEILEKIDRY